MQLWGPIQGCLAWHELIWAPLQEELKDIGFCWEKFIAEQPVCIGTHGELTRIERAVITALLPILGARLLKLKLQRIENQLHELSSCLDLAWQNFGSSRVIAGLPEAVNRLVSDTHPEAHASLPSI